MSGLMNLCIVTHLPTFCGCLSRQKNHKLL